MFQSGPDRVEYNRVGPSRGHKIYIFQVWSGSGQDITGLGCQKLCPAGLYVGLLSVFNNSLFVTGFKEQIYDVYRYLPPATQVVLFSATLPHEILEMTEKFMTDPIRILVKR